MTVLLAQVSPPPFSFELPTVVVFVLANVIILYFVGPRLLKDLRKGS